MRKRQEWYLGSYADYSMTTQSSEHGSRAAGCVTHFQGSPGEVGWSCGYKNIQMQISHLLKRDQVTSSPPSMALWQV